MSTWLTQHIQAFRAALRKLIAQRAASVLNVFVIGIALSLPAGGYALLTNLQAIAQRFSLEPQISVFLDPAAKPAERDALGARLKSTSGAAHVHFMPRDEALKKLRHIEGLAEVIDALGQNPLPDAYVVRLNAAAPEMIEALASDLRRQPGVSHVQADSAWARRLAALVGIGRLGMALLAALLAIGLVAVTFNTIRLQILTQRDEIEVSKLLGATDGFIRRPFYYLGALQGFAGGLVGLAIPAASLMFLNSGVRELAATYGSGFELAFLVYGDAISVVLFASLLGWLGAYLSVNTQL